VAGSAEVHEAPTRSAPRAPLAIAALLLVVAAGCWVLTGSLYPAFSSDDLLPALGLAVVFLAAESTQLHLEFRRQTHSISASELPLVFGLFVVAPGTLLSVRIAAGALVMIARRRPPIKIYFNLCLMAAETTLAVVTMRTVLAGRPIEVTDAYSWLAVAAALGAVFLIANAAVMSAIALTEGVPTWSETVAMVAPGFLVSVLNAAVALTVMLAVASTPWAVVPLVVLGGLLTVGYRGWLRSRRQHRVLNRV
jgi:hypothetical protein